MGLKNNIGVKQGSVESPVMFAWLVDLIIAYTKGRRGHDEPWFQGSRLHHTAFMDDIVTWAATTSVLQRQISTLQAILSKWGLSINLSKSQLLVHGNVGAKEVFLGNSKLVAMTQGEPLMVMGIPIGPKVTGMEVLESYM